jgi:hypothetical protein
MQQTTRSLHYLTIGADKKVSSTNFGDHQFDPRAFSRFKYGDNQVAQHYAARLAELLISEGVLQKDCIYYMCGPAYQQVPTAAVAITDCLPDLLRAQGYQISEFKISGQAFGADFSNKNIEQRRTALAQITLTAPDEIRKAIRNQRVIVIDDIKVTGLHETAIARLLSSCNTGGMLFCYVASLEREGSVWWPEVEWDLNHCYMNSLERLAELMQDPYFVINSRVCKFVLAQPAAEIKTFAAQLSPQLRTQLVNAILADEYHLMDSLSDTAKIFLEK